MRSAVFVAILVASAALLSGCAKKEDDDHSFTCPNGTTIDLEQYPDHHNATFSAVSHCPKSGTGSKSGSASNTTSLAPNKLPILKLMIMSGSNMTNVTMLNGNLTFDATGSSDPDGSITGIAVTVQDSNTTRTATLYDSGKKTFKTATFKFDRPGIVNVTVAMVDDRAGFTVNQTHVYVDHLQVGASVTIAAPGGTPGIGGPCDIGDDIIGASFYKEFSFVVVNGATLLEAKGDASSQSGVGDVVMTICGPDGTEMSTPGNPTATTTGGPFPAPKGIDSYKVGMTGDGGAEIDVVPTALVHYEPGATAKFT